MAALPKSQKGHEKGHGVKKGHGVRRVMGSKGHGVKGSWGQRVMGSGLASTHFYHRMQALVFAFELIAQYDIFF